MKRQKQFATRMYGETILERLKELGMSKADLIRSANISPSTLNRAIEGKSVHMHTIVAIAHALDIDSDIDLWETSYYNPRFDRK